MVDYNEAIKNLQTINGMPLTIRLAIEALEKQIPKKPTRKWNTIVCPSCVTEHRCRTLFHWEHFCPDCGQAIDWSDE